MKIITAIILLILGTNLVSTGYFMLLTAHYNTLVSILVMIAGAAFLVSAYALGFTIYQNHKDKLKEFFNKKD